MRLKRPTRMLMGPSHARSVEEQEGRRLTQVYRGRPDVAAHAGGREHREEQPEDEAHERADDGHEQLDLRGVGVPLDVRHPTEEEERDAPHGNAVGARDERVRELVHDDRSEEQHRRDQRDEDDRGERPRRVPVAEDRAEVPDDEQQDEKPAHVEGEIDPEDTAEANAAVHGARLPGVRRDP